MGLIALRLVLTLEARCHPEWPRLRGDNGMQMKRGTEGEQQNHFSDFRARITRKARDLVSLGQNKDEEQMGEKNDTPRNARGWTAWAEKYEKGKEVKLPK